MIAVQTIHIHWTKNSRGGELATLRNRVPRKFPLRIPPDFPTLVWHTLRFAENNRFETPHSEAIETDCSDDQFGCSNISIERGDDSAVLAYRYRDGAPPRQFYDKTGTNVSPSHSIVVGMNQWATIEYNGRHSTRDGMWWYEHVIVNVAVTKTLDHRAFLATTPIERYTQLALLR